MRDSIKRVWGRFPIRAFERLQRYVLFEQRFAEIRDAQRFATRENLWEDLFAGVRDRPVCVLEFGVWKGYSIHTFAGLNDHPESRFFGFDSFEGLPEDWHETRPKGYFSTGGAAPQAGDARVRFVKGWFQESLPRFREENQELFHNIRSGRLEPIVHFDADLFSSTLFVMSFLDPLVDRYRFIFDDFIADEIRALHAASVAFLLRPEFRGFVPGANTGYPIQVSGILHRTLGRSGRQGAD